MPTKHDQQKSNLLAIQNLDWESMDYVTLHHGIGIILQQMIYENEKSMLGRPCAASNVELLNQLLQPALKSVRNFEKRRKAV